MPFCQFVKVIRCPVYTNPYFRVVMKRELVDLRTLCQCCHVNFLFLMALWAGMQYV